MNVEEQFNTSTYVHIICYILWYIYEPLVHQGDILLSIDVLQHYVVSSVGHHSEKIN